MGDGGYPGPSGGSGPKGPPGRGGACVPGSKGDHGQPGNPGGPADLSPRTRDKDKTLRRIHVTVLLFRQDNRESLETLDTSLAPPVHLGSKDFLDDLVRQNFSYYCSK
ncbi:hypothetical protein EYF80_028741 [Liparis tanakae]|uniref:Uncharacterized protein n=1 Tax=Liparis tanakae TaxID=230148 RepID=A0A4Z2H5E8_9TELE|nr:hypothetical protein EYF80_028741 [Liparis tanakae]